VVVAGVMSELGGDVGVAVEAEQPDRCVAQGGHDVWPTAGSVLGVVFGEGDVADPVQAVLDGPVLAKPGGDLGGSDIEVRA
jgi:hypothetical protein